MQSYSIGLSCPCRHLLAQLVLFSLVCFTNGVSSSVNCFRPRFDLVGCKSRLLVADAENVKSGDDGRKQSNDESLLAGPIPILFNLGKKAIGGMMNFSVPQSDLWVDQEKRRKRIQDKLYWACRKGRTGKMMEMIGQGADVNKRDSLPMVNFTPLIYASAFGKVDAVKLLMNHQVDVNAQDWNQWTALHWAAHGVKQEHVKIAEILIQHGANIHETTWDGRTPRSIAEDSRQRKIIEMIDKYCINERSFASL
ncbi:hypothetical protein GUITHDRAFT_144537 [Guillardia theta CCMP2712]|uniref:Uncharacterized protein n=1 Tax=Guillardia theta (strain CCMP2712) TaxID=905079 RepID=L1IQ83_GUITC|nr:hypothetical protein GUITHDRAFT_144537 [Guillardia theta CCMP2712]EKX38044.1 hypothetical protein GUITHDRAFT_144537 [Guillardia theta CCMP2712]|eukprot:XP_005825024.1 hypothetical protein GUITHDRAFT_144537 [Guillardia theta CCMP2712]